MSGRATGQTVERALDPRGSAWVSANAGAGKTYLLTNRVARLLLDGANPARILCLTYTKAAAAEMAGRLFGQLGDWAMLPDAELAQNIARIGGGKSGPERLRVARRLFASALETPGGLKIQTIHSFCQHVLARFPVEAAIPARFQVLDERSAAELMAEARLRVLVRAGRNGSALGDAVATLAARAGDGRYADILADALGRESGKLLALVDRHGGQESFFAHLRQTLGTGLGEDEDAVVVDFCAGLVRERAALERAAKTLLAGSANDIRVGKPLAEFAGAGCAPRAIEALRGALLTGDGEPRKTLVTKATAKSDPALAPLLASLQQRLIAMEERRKAAAVATLTEALVSVALATRGAYEDEKRARAALDYEDLIARTLALLARADAAAWVLYKLDGGLDHILVDEAQDTSPEQWDVVKALAGEFFAGAGARDDPERPRTVFAVGDEKQSIFSFQGAEPEAFGQNREHFKARTSEAGHGFADCKLEVSRRGAPDVLRFVDAIFADGDARDGLTSGGDPIHHLAHREKAAGRVELWPTIKPVAEEEKDPWAPVDAAPRHAPASRLAGKIADWIKGRIDEGLWLASKNDERGGRADAGDIMILVRRRGPFAEEMIRQLMERGVAVAGADRMKLTDQIAILDLVALARFALFPADDLTLASLLKSPLCGLDEDDLFALAHGRKGTLWQALGLRKDEPRFAPVHAALAEALAEADYPPPFEFFSRALGPREGRAKLLARLGPEAGDAIDEFLALALAYESAHPPSLEGFLAWFARGASEIKRDMEAAGDAVRVMTVHGAKGLEAPIVIVPDTTQIPDHARRGGLLYTEDCVFFGAPKELETAPVAAAKARAHAREMREYRRLLYVALTRAKDRLVVCGFEGKHGAKADSWYKLAERAARRIGREVAGPDGEPILVVGEDAEASENLAKTTPKAGPDLPAFARLAVEAEPPGPRLLRPSEAAEAEEPPVLSPFAGRGAERFKRGLAIHALLAQLPAVEPAVRADTARHFLERRGFDAAQAAALAAETLAVLDDREIAPLFARTSRAEIPISASLPELGAGIRVSGQIDRIAIGEDEILIADFKTNRPAPATVDETPALYRAQMALYRAALAKIYPGRRITCVLVWTDGPRAHRLPDAMMDAEIAKIAARPKVLAAHLDPTGRRS